MKIRGILFDYDHTLVDSPIDFAAMRAGVMDHLAASGVTVEAAQQKLILEVVAEAVAAADEAVAGELRRRCDEHILSVELDAAAAARAIDGVPETLRCLRAAGRKVGIITRNCRAVIEQVTAHIPLAYDILLTRDDVPLVKPAPEHAWAALEAMGVPPHDAILVGDFRGDIECAQRAGLPAVGVLTGHADGPTLRAAGACAVLPSAAHLPGWLAEMGW